MQTTLSEHAKSLPRGEEAESILRSCVHCGFRSEERRVGKECPV